MSELFTTIKQEIPGGFAEVSTMHHEGREFTALGACVSDSHIAVYAGPGNTVRSFEGAELGTFAVTGEYQRWSSFGRYTMRSVRIILKDGRTYHGRYSTEFDLIRAKRAKKDARR